ncbi:retrovirus-related pol polyprotein from transposon TNT 1-94 [Tanacetum coccineum]
MDESIPWDQKCKSSKELFKIKSSVDTIFDGVERCKQTIAKRTYFGHIDPFIQNTIEGNFCPQIRKINADLEKFHLCLKEEMVADLRYFNSLEHEVDSLKSQLETQKTQFLNEIDRLSREYYYADHMNAILGVYTTLDEFTDLQCDYVDQVVKCERLEKELSKRTNNVNNKSFNELSKRFSELEQHSINLELALQQSQEQLNNDKVWKQKESNSFRELNVKYFEIQDLKAQLQDKDIAISELKKLTEKMKGKSVKTKFEKPSVIRQPNAFKSQRQSVLVTAQILPQNVKSILKNTNVIALRIYNVHTKPNQTRMPQLPQDIRKTNKCVSFSTGVIPTTSVSKPQLRSNRLEDIVMHNNSEGKKQQVENHHRNFKFSNNKTSVTACNNSLNAKTSNVNFVCVTCGKCVLNDNHDMCVLHYINGVNSRTKMPMDVPISTRELMCCLYPIGWSFMLVEIILFIVDSRCSKYMTRNLKLLSNFVEQFMGTVKFGNDQIASILVAFQNSTCYICDLKGNDLLTGSRGTNMYSITLQDTSTPNLIFIMAKATSSQAWLWHRRLSYLNFNTINLLSKYDIVTGLPKLKFVKDHLCSSCELRKLKRKSFKTKTTSSSNRRLQILHMDLCGPMRVESFNDETPKVLINFLKLVQRGLHAQVRTVRTDKGTEFLNKTLHVYFAQEGIEHQTSTARTPEQNGVIEKQNHTLVEATRTMLSAAKVPLFCWAEAIAIACFIQNRSLVIPRHGKSSYHIINGRKPSVKFFHIFGSLCYIVKDGENLDKMKEKGDACIFVGYSTQSRAYRVYNKRTRVIVETIHVNFDKLSQMASDHVSSDPVPQCSTTALEHDSLSPGPQSQENVPQAAETVTTSNELDLLFSLMFDELLNGTTTVVSMSFTVTATDVPNQRQQQNITPSTSTTVAADIPPLNIQTTPETTNQAPTQAPTVIANENIIQAETNKEHAQVDEDEFINIFSTPVQDQGETSS